MVMLHIVSRLPRLLLIQVALVACLVTARPGKSQEPGQQVFSAPAGAVAALVQALRNGDNKALLSVLGASARKFVSSGDPVADKNAAARFVTLYDAKNSLAQRGTDAMELIVGPDDWALPIPLVQTNGRWYFDSNEGAEILINRRIGRNELLTIRTLLAGAAAQRDYFDRFKTGTGAGAYAQRVMSTPGRTDGLYWEVPEGQPSSPLGPLVDQAVDEGYPGTASPDGKPIPYHGYIFRILKAQGPNAPGGEKNYMRNGQMTGGFAFVAAPAAYGNSGVVTFIMGPEGIVFQKDLGPNTARAVAEITRFDPDLSWARVDVTD